MRFLAFLTNLLLNQGKSGEVTHPPLSEEGDPKELPRANLLWRKCLEQLIYYSDPHAPDYRPQIPDEQRVTIRKLLIRHCYLDPVFFAAGFGWGIDTRLPTHLQVRPFLPWEEQREAFWTISRAIDSEESVDLVAVKGRDVGMTFILVLECLRRWLLHDESFIWTTLSKEKLDNRKPDSVFGKMRFIFYRLPHWMRPPGWGDCTYIKPDKDSSLTKPVWRQDVLRAQAGYWVAEGTAIDGVAATGEATVGGRYKVFVGDEYGALGQEKPGEDAAMWLKASASAHCRIAAGTPRGKHTQHSKLVRQADAQKGQTLGPAEKRIEKIFLNWRHDPRKNVPRFRITVRPQQYMDMVEYYTILLRLFYYEQELGIQDCIQLVAGEYKPTRPDSERATLEKEYGWYKGRCAPLDPDEDATELAREFSPWVLAECKDHSATPEGREHIVTDVWGEWADTAEYLFSDEKLERQPVCEPEMTGDFDGLLEDVRMARFNPELPGQIQVWKAPQVGRLYGMTSDSGMGQGKDYSVIAVWDVTDWPIEQVAQFRCNRTGPERLALYVFALHRWYAFRRAEGEEPEFGAFWLPESNAEGRSTISRAIIELRFPRQSIYIQGDHPEEIDDITPYGWRSSGNKSSSGREMIFTSFREQLEDARAVQIHSAVMRAELSSILTDKFQPDEEEGTGNDDTAIVGALMPQMVQGFNKSVRGEWVFDVLGPQMRMKHNRKQQERSKRERAGKPFRGVSAGRNKSVPIWGERRGKRTVAA
jgi:hypothetical protein